MSDNNDGRDGWEIMLPSAPKRQSTIFGDSASLNEYQKLWGAVIERALLDAQWNPANSEDNSRCSGIPRAQMLNARGDALRWLRGNTEDFKTVCEAAGLNPGYVKRLAAEHLGEDLIWDNHFRAGRGGTSQGADT